VRIEYDPEADAMYIRLLEGTFQTRSVRLTDEVALDMGPQEQLVGIEIIDARRILAGGQLPGVVVSNLPVKAA